MNGRTTLCSVCGAVLTSGGRLCRDDADQLLTEVRFAHDLLRELDTTFARLDKVTASSVGGKSSETPLPFHASASQVAGELRAAIRAMGSRTGGPIGADVLRFREAKTRAMECVDIPDPRVFLGVCDCDVPVYARSHESQVACKGCGELWDVVPADTSNLLTTIGQHSGTVAEVSGLLRMAGLPIKTNTLQWWTRAGYLGSVGRSRRGYPTYRIADVVQVYADRAQKRRKAS